MTPVSPQQKSRSSDSQAGAMNIFTIEKYLKMLKHELNYTILFKSGPIRLKKSFHIYRNWLLEKEFITNRKQPRKTVRDGTRGRPFFAPHSFFKITLKGRKFLVMIQ